MDSIDVKIYLNQFISFFEKNPESLYKLIGEINKDIFFEKVREKCFENLKNNDDVALTKTQLEELIVGLWGFKYEVKRINNEFISTRFGLIVS
jgi:hypothetical protein